MSPAARVPHRAATAALVWATLLSGVLVLAAPARGVSGPEPPHLLPGAGARASAHTPAWIVGVDARGAPAVPGLARRFGATPIAGLPAYSVPVGRARAFAATLARAGELTFSEPDRALPSASRPTFAGAGANGAYATFAQAAGPGSLAPYEGWRSYIVAPGLVPPAPGPLLALVDSQAQVDHPAFAGSNISSTGTAAPTDEHGTGTIAVAAARDTGLGFEGIYPGARALNIPTALTCIDLAKGIVAAVDHHAAVVNLSFGSRQSCFLLYLAVMDDVNHDVLPVAAAGNEYDKGNPLSYPASYPHVLTVGAIGPDYKPTFFSTSNLGVDLGAPGIGILTAVPPQFDTDGTMDGYEGLSGTSFSSPMVAAAADWIRAVRPALSGQQVADLLRATARDIWKRGYDTDTGYGLPRLARALTARAPHAAGHEPNDDIPFVDGRLFGRPDRPIWSGRSPGRRIGVLDVFKNPTDVYRISVPAHARVRVDVRSHPGFVEMALYDRSAVAISDHKLALARRIRADRVVELVNHRSHRHVYYVAVGTQSVITVYELTVRR